MKGLLKFKIIEYIWAIESLIEELVNKITKKVVIIITSWNLFIEIEGYVRNDFVKNNESELFSVITKYHLRMGFIGKDMKINFGLILP